MLQCVAVCWQKEGQKEGTQEMMNSDFIELSCNEMQRVVVCWQKEGAKERV